jgi:hypothetical protein
MEKSSSKYKIEDFLVTEKAKMLNLPESNYTLLLVCNEDIEDIVKLISRYYTQLKKKREEYKIKKAEQLKDKQEKPSGYRKNELKIPKLIQLHDAIKRDEVEIIIARAYKNKRKVAVPVLLKDCGTALLAERERKRKEEEGEFSDSSDSSRSE